MCAGGYAESWDRLEGGRDRDGCWRRLSDRSSLLLLSCLRFGREWTNPCDGVQNNVVGLGIGDLGTLLVRRAPRLLKLRDCSGHLMSPVSRVNSPHLHFRFISLAASIHLVSKVRNF